MYIYSVFYIHRTYVPIIHQLFLGGCRVWSGSFCFIPDVSYLGLSLFCRSFQNSITFTDLFKEQIFLHHFSVVFAFSFIVSALLFSFSFLLLTLYLFCFLFVFSQDRSLDTYVIHFLFSNVSVYCYKFASRPCFPASHKV